MTLLDDRMSTIHERAKGAAACWDDYWTFCEHVQTEWEEADEGIVRYPYPTDWKFLREYHDAYKQAYQDKVPFVCVKSRGMLATTDPLVDWLWEASRREAHGGIWRVAIVRQSQHDADLLIERTRVIHKHLPAYLKRPLTKDNVDELRIGDNCILRALHSQGEAGRGEGWDIVLFDEMAYQEHASRNWVAFDRARLKMGVSTPNGEGNKFHDLAMGTVASARIYDLGFEDHPHRTPDTPVGDEWQTRKRESMTNPEWLVEYCRRFDVYAEPGLLSDDFSEKCVVDQLDWDGSAQIVISFDPGFVDGAGAMIRYANEFYQDCRLKEFFAQNMLTEDFTEKVCKYAKAHWPDAEYLLTGDVAAKQRKTTKDRFNANTDEQVIVRVSSQILSDADYDENGALVSGQPLPYQIDNLSGYKRKEGHRLLRSAFHVRPGDGRRGALVSGTGCPKLIQAFRGGYKLPKNATPKHKENEEPDRSMQCVHICDADRYGYLQFLKTGGIPSYQPRRKTKAVGPIQVLPRMLQEMRR